MNIPEDSKLWPVCVRCMRKVSRFIADTRGATVRFRAECHGASEECEVDAKLVEQLLHPTPGGARLRPDRAFPVTAFQLLEATA